MKATITFFAVFIISIIILNAIFPSTSSNELIVKVLVAGLFAGFSMWVVSARENSDS